MNQIKSCGDTIEDKRVVGKMLRSLPSKFDHVAAAIEESKDLSKITMYELTGSLLAHEQRINRSSDSLTEQAFESKQVPKSKYNNKGKWRNNNRENKQSQNSDNNGGCIICKKTNHVSKDCFHKCKRCKIPNHSQRDCWFQNKEKNKGKEEAKFSNETKEEILFYSSANQPSKSVWYLDSGCSNHMTGNRDTFVKLDPNITSQIILGDGSRKSGKGKGDIAVQTKEGKEKLITDVLYVPELSHNLLSVGQLMEKNFSFLFDDGRCQIFDKTNKVIVTNIEMKNKTFSLTMPLVEDRALKVDNAELSSLWHLRYGHLHDRALILLKEKNMVIGLPSIEPSGKVCEGCVYGKMHKLPFPKTSWQAKSPLELVHSDICGPMQTPTPGRKRYFILFIDDYTRMMWIYFLNQKSEAFSTFMQFKAQAERESGFLIKSLRTDRGGEYLSNPFSEYCKANGIKRQLTTSYTPQQNGVAERKNRTIVEMARSMLKYKGIPNLYWAEAVHTAAYIMNRSPTKAVHNMTPYEAWHKKKPVVDHFKIFGSLAYALLPSQRREKFDSKGQKLIFIGYSNESKGYRLLDPSTLKIIVSRDVIFDESSSWDFKEKQVVESDYYETPSPTEAGPSQVENGEKHRNEVESDEESPPKKTRPLVEIYERALLASEPHSYEEASKDKNWVNAMNEEMSTIKKNQTWELVDLPKGKKTIGLKWIFKIKFNEDGSIHKHKARLVAKGYSQQPGIDFTETYAPVARIETIRTVLAMAAQLELQVYQLDVKSAFLNGEIEEEVYVDQPEGFMTKGLEEKVCHLKKALYGLKQAPRAWNSKINGYFIESGFKRSLSESSLYVKNVGNDFLVLCLYVDDLIYFGTNPNLVEEIKKNMMEKFAMSDLGSISYFLGIQVKQSPGRIFLSQEKYIEDLLKKFNMSHCKPISTPMALNEKLHVNDDAEKIDPTTYRKLVGSLLYINTRPDITHAVSLLSRFMNEPSKIHLSSAKRILRYLKGTKDHGIEFKKEDCCKLVGYTDSDWAGSVDDRKSTSGYIFCLGTKVISWSSKKQKSVALSSAEAEYIAATDAACEGVWLRRILKDLKFEQKEPTTIFCDNMSTIAMTKNPVFHARSKHIELRHHFIRELVNEKEISMEFINTNNQPADFLTKAVTSEKFEKFKRQVKITNYGGVLKGI